MADSAHSTLDFEQLNKLAADLGDHADSITQVTLHQLEADIRKAAQVVEQHAEWRISILDYSNMLTKCVELADKRQITADKLSGTVTQIANSLRAMCETGES